MVTIIIPISRPDFLDKLFATLEFMECDRDQTNLLTYVDGDHRLYTKARNLTMQSKFKERLCLFRSRGTPSVSSVKRRRQRIADIHNEIKTNIKECKYIFCIEDDTIPPKNALTQLLKHYSYYPFAGLISGVEIGRWGYNHIGAWKLNSLYDVTKVTSLEPGLTGLQKVDAAGFYCFMTRSDLYKKHNFQPFEDALGPDVEYSVALRREGLDIYADMDLKCEHHDKKGPITFGNVEVEQVQLEKLPNGRWATGRPE